QPPAHRTARHWRTGSARRRACSWASRRDSLGPSIYNAGGEASSVMRGCPRSAACLRTASGLELSARFSCLGSRGRSARSTAPQRLQEGERWGTRGQGPLRPGAGAAVPTLVLPPLDEPARGIGPSVRDIGGPCCGVAPHHEQATDVVDREVRLLGPCL